MTLLLFTLLISKFLFTVTQPKAVFKNWNFYLYIFILRFSPLGLMLTYMFWTSPGDRALYLRGNIAFLSLLAVLMYKSRKTIPDPTCYEPSNLRASHNLHCTMKEITLFHAMIPHEIWIMKTDRVVLLIGRITVLQIAALCLCYQHPFPSHTAQEVESS